MVSLYLLYFAFFFFFFVVREKNSFLVLTWCDHLGTWTSNEISGSVMVSNENFPWRKCATQAGSRFVIHMPTLHHILSKQDISWNSHSSLIWRNGAINQGMRVALRRWKRQENRFFSKVVPEKHSPANTLIFSPLGFVSNFWVLEPWENNVWFLKPLSLR